MSQFEKLMSELGQLGADQVEMTKALPADDGKDEKKIQAAAAESGLDGGEGGEGGDAGADAGGDAGAEGDDKKTMAKSFKFTLEDGTEVEAQDGAELVKSLMDRVDQTEGNMLKAMDAAVNLIKGQGELIKSMQDHIKKLGGEGRGRKAVVSVVEKPAPGEGVLAKSEPAGLTSDQFFAKAFAAQREGRISGMDISIAESCLNRGEAIPQHIVQRVAQ